MPKKLYITRSHGQRSAILKEHEVVQIVQDMEVFVKGQYATVITALAKQIKPAAK